MKECAKCDKRGMINDGGGAYHSCDCGKHNRQMKEIFKDFSLGDLLGYANKRIKEKKLLTNNN